MLVRKTFILLTNTVIRFKVEWESNGLCGAAIVAAAALPAPRKHLQYPVQLVKRLSTQSARRESLQLGEGKLF